MVSFLTGIQSISAQTKSDSAYIFLPEANAQQGNVLIIPVKISYFDIVNGVQFSVNWDSTMLSYQGVSDFGLNKMTLGENFGNLKTSAGQLGFLWYDTATKGIPATTNQTLFSLKLKVIGNNKSTPLIFTDKPSDIEVLNLANKPMKLGMKNGKVNIGNISSDDDATDFIETILHEVYPNPLGNNGAAKIRLDIAQASNVQILFYDISGKNILHINKFYNIGTHFVELSRNQFPQAGIYPYTIKTAFGNNLSGKLMVK
jgi:hypothetical protein